MDFFYNPNIALTIVEQVPCSFAPLKDGEMGTHFVCIMLDDCNNVLHMDCQCEEAHGEDAIRTMEEMGGGTCYEFIGKVRDTLEGQDVDTWRGDKTGRALREQLNRVISGVKNTRSSRLRLTRANNHAEERSSGGKLWAAMLTRVARTVSGNPTLSVSWVESSIEGSPAFFSFNLDSDCMATRGPKSEWYISTSRQDIDKAFQITEDAASRHYHHGSRVQDECCVCNKSYERMSKHTESEGHRKTLEDQIKRALKFTAGKGLAAVREKGAVYFKPRGRRTVGKVQARADLIARYMRQNSSRPNKQEWGVWSGALGFKHIAITRFCIRTEIPRDDAEELFQLVHDNSEYITTCNENTWGMG